LLYNIYLTHTAIHMSYICIV